MRIAACIKWVDTRPEVDLLTGDVHTDDRSRGASVADRAAVEVACRIAEAWGGTVELITAGPAGADHMLRELGAVGARRLSRVDLGLHDGATPDSTTTAAALCRALVGVDVVVCGDHSLDRGSGSVPSFLAHELGAAQCLGLVELEVAAPGVVVGTRRIGFGRAERVQVQAPAVISVEGAVATLRRAPLSGVLVAQDQEIELLAAQGLPNAPAERTEPLRPRTHRLQAPTAAAARDRIVELTGALVDRTPPRTVEATPEEAAGLILEQLRAWGYLE